MPNDFYASMFASKKQGRKQFAVLIDPDKMPSKEAIVSFSESGADCFFIGGSLLTNGHLRNCIDLVKTHSKLPVVLFPGSVLQIDDSADAILLLSLISGRNPEMLIGNHVVAAPLLKRSNLEVIATGYMLIESGDVTSVSYMSNTMPIPSGKHDIALCTAMAGEMLGHKLIYMDAGSGAKQTIEAAMIEKVKEGISIPLIVGGGIKSADDAKRACDAGADMIVIGNAFEKDSNLVKKISNVFNK